MKIYLLTHPRVRMMIIIKSDHNAGQMSQRSSEDQDVKDIMRTPHKVESARIPSFGYPEGVDERAGGVNDALKSEPAPAHLSMRLRNAVFESCVCHGQDPGEAEREEHACSKGIP